MRINDKLRAFIMRTPRGAEWIACRALRRDSQLRHSGWFRTVHCGMSVDAENRPLPWYTYSAISFLGERVRPTMNVFEYGSGNSTLWWSQRVAHLSGCEHDRGWYDIMKPRLPANVDCQFVGLDDSGSYPESIKRSGKRFDIVVIDGRQRVRCARAALDALTDDGVIVWDNTDREEYREGYDLLRTSGFRRIDFTGMGPINTLGSCTSVFYRTANVFEI